jgi:hypothetical protein
MEASTSMVESAAIRVDSLKGSFMKVPPTILPYRRSALDGPRGEPRDELRLVNRYTTRIGTMAIDAPASMMCHSAAALTEYLSCTTATEMVMNSGRGMVMIRVVT